ncbi:hypothetical protein HYC85_010503, partial [Camellia sinensis]
IHLYNRISLKKKCKSASDSIPIPISHPSKNAAGVDNTFQRKFDREEYLERAREREQKETKSRVLLLSVCECVVKDSANYLDHINGKKHQRALGMSMRVEQASLEQVQERFELLKKRKDTGPFTEQDKVAIMVGGEGVNSDLSKLRLEASMSPKQNISNLDSLITFC